jgi:hypothetical protein
LCAMMLKCHHIYKLQAFKPWTLEPSTRSPRGQTEDKSRCW